MQWSFKRQNRSLSNNEQFRCYFNCLGYDQLLNLVIDQTIEYLRDPDDEYKISEDTRQLGLVVCRGTSVVLICPLDGMEEIPNPFGPHE